MNTPEQPPDRDLKEFSDLVVDLAERGSFRQWGALLKCEANYFSDGQRVRCMSMATVTEFKPAPNAVAMSVDIFENTQATPETLSTGFTRYSLSFIPGSDPNFTKEFGYEQVDSVSGERILPEWLQRALEAETDEEQAKIGAEAAGKMAELSGAIGSQGLDPGELEMLLTRLGRIDSGALIDNPE